jgi:hypothetical protein
MIGPNDERSADLLTAQLTLLAVICREQGRTRAEALAMLRAGVEQGVQENIHRIAETPNGSRIVAEVSACLDVAIEEAYR